MKSSLSKIRVTIFLIVCVLSICLIYRYCIKSDKKIEIKDKYLTMIEKSYYNNKPEWPPHPNKVVNYKDTSLGWFFKEWEKTCYHLKKVNTNEIEDEIYKIFPIVYHPTDLKKYGILDFSYLLKYKYAIVPSIIKYGVVSDINSEDNSIELADKKLCNFHPKSKTRNLTFLYNIDPFKSAINNFLDKEPYGPRSFYLDIYIAISEYRADNNLDWLKFDYILFNSDLSKSVVCINLWEDENGDEIYIYLTQKDQKWYIDSIRNNIEKIKTSKNAL